MKNSSSLFDHYLITRFNLRKKEWTTSKNNTLVLTDQWLTNRMKLFETYCYPSVTGQKNQSFKWLVYFDTTTPDVFKTRIEELHKAFPAFQPIFCDGMDQFLPSIKSDLALNNKPYIITTRLDNDDCIATDFVENIQQSFNSQRYIALDFVKGWTLSIAKPYKLGVKVQAYNPFMSLIEINDQPETIWSKGHTEWKREKRVLQNNTDLIWMSIIHQENKINDFTGFGNCDADKVLSGFSLSKPMKAELASNLAPSSQWRWINLVNRIDSYYKFYSKEIKKKINLY